MRCVDVKLSVSPLCGTVKLSVRWVHGLLMEWMVLSGAADGCVSVSSSRGGKRKFGLALFLTDGVF